LCARRQRRILEELWTCLRPGGILLYSTCTYNHAENEQQLAWLRAELGAEPLPLVLPPDWPVLQSHGFLRCYPQLMPGEGFFLGAVLKPDGPRARLRPRSRLQTLPARESAGFSDWLSGEWGFGRRGDTLLAWPQQHLETITLLQQLKGVTTGMELAEIKGKSGLHPLPELALSVRFSPGAFPQLELSLSQAIAYLQGQALYDLPAGPPGHGLACFDGWALGWLKRVEQRANNLYPQAWRLRMRPAAAEVAANWEQLQRLLPLRR
ncbi:MAG: rRNA methyltransferase, partial [Candidatus Sericytochromatia bacterium]